MLQLAYKLRANWCLTWHLYFSVYRHKWYFAIIILSETEKKSISRFIFVAFGQKKVIVTRTLRLPDLSFNEKTRCINTWFILYFIFWAHHPCQPMHETIYKTIFSKFTFKRFWGQITLQYLMQNSLLQVGIVIIWYLFGCKRWGLPRTSKSKSFSAAPASLVDMHVYLAVWNSEAVINVSLYPSELTLWMPERKP